MYARMSIGGMAATSTSWYHIPWHSLDVLSSDHSIPFAVLVGMDSPFPRLALPSSDLSCGGGVHFCYLHDGRIVANNVPISFTPSSWFAFIGSIAGAVI